VLLLLLLLLLLLPPPPPTKCLLRLFVPLNSYVSL
jgi:hypothetical protein